MGRLTDKVYLDTAAKKFALGVENGIDEDELVDMELRLSDDLQSKYKDKIKEKLQKRAAELKAEEDERRARLARSFLLGQEAFECGEYVAAVRLLEKGVEEAGPDTPTGGEAQMWLALAYQACAREQDAINMCKNIEENHPIRKFKKQAFDLRYILEAPKLEGSPDEVVTIPLIQSDNWRQRERKASMSSRNIKAKKPVSTTYWDRVSWDVPTPSFVPDKWYYKVLWVAVIIMFTLFLNMQATK